MDDVDELVSEEDAIAVYPNPAKDVVYLKGTDIQYVEVYNTLGMQILARNINDSESIDIADFAKGMYFLRITDNKGNISIKKFIKE